MCNLQCVIVCDNEFHIFMTVLANNLLQTSLVHRDLHSLYAHLLVANMLSKVQFYSQILNINKICMLLTFLFETFLLPSQHVCEYALWSLW